jgi:CofD-related protein of GAK system
MRRIVMFGGGSGSRDITMALCQQSCDITRVVPAWDSGGSSKALRERLGILAMGDIRQALMTLAHGEDRVSGVVRFFNARLSEAADGPELQAEFEFYASGAHPLLATMTPDIRRAVLECLRVFKASVGHDFDWRRGSIGNFVLTGAYLSHGRDINAAIAIFRQLCGIEGQVWPSTMSDTVALQAHLGDGSVVHGQDRVTALSPAQGRWGIQQVQLSQTDDAAKEARPPVANPAVLAAVAAADLLVFGPGSFFTSTLAHFSVQGIAQAIAQTSSRVPKVLIGNILECPETTGRSLAELVQAFEMAAGDGALTHVLVNRGWVPFTRVVKGFRYLTEGQMSLTTPMQLVVDDFEDPWRRGRHDAQKLATHLVTLGPSGQNGCSAVTA